MFFCLLDHNDYFYSEKIIMSLFKNLTIVLGFFISLTSFGQNKRFVEEVAMYHLDSLTKSDPAFKLVLYYSKGTLVSSKTSIKDTIDEAYIKKNVQMKSVFKDLTIVEKDKLTSFPFTEHKMKNKNYTPLNIYHYMKIKDNYFVFFDIQGNYGGTNILLVMDLKGDLVRYKLMTYKN